MKIAVSANGHDLDAPTSPVFGRCPISKIVWRIAFPCIRPRRSR
jgi:hypothetical protein